MLIQSEYHLGRKAKCNINFISFVIFLALSYLIIHFKREMTEQAPEKKNEEKKEEFVVTAWEVSGKVDYMKLINQFGTELITPELLEKFKRITGKELHPWLKRGIFFTHKYLEKWLDAYEAGEPVFLYTGRGPSNDPMHLGHLIPFLFTKWIQETFDCPLVIQISDEEKAAFKNLNFEDLHRMGFENAKEIISCGFDPKKTFIFSNRDYRLNCPQYENFSSDLKNNVSIKSIQAIFGLKGTGNVGMYDWPIFQSSAAFWQSYPHIFGGRPAHCLVPYAIDQDPYFRLARDASSKMNLIKPASIMSKFIPPLSGQDGKMSSSKGSGAIYLSDSEEVIREKVITLCKSGADPDPEVHKQKGGDVEKDIAYQYLRYFEHDDKKLEEIKEGFTKGTLSAIGIKELLAEKIISIIKEIQENRKKIDDNLLKDFYAMKPMNLPKPKMKEPTKEESELYEALDKLSIAHTTKYHSIISTKDQAESLAQTIEGTICKGALLKTKEGYVFEILTEQTVITPKLLAKQIGTKTLRFAESDTYEQMLKVNPKKIPSPFALINDKEKKVLKVLIDENIDKEKSVSFLALREDGTCTIAYKDMIKFIESLGYNIVYVK